MFLFVYGTLKSQFHNNHYLSKATYISTFILLDFKLVEAGGLPAVLPSKGDRVRGELYKIDNETLQRLDQLECNGVFYIRVNGKAMLDVENNYIQPREVIVYSGAPKYWSKAKDGSKDDLGVYEWTT